MSKVFARVAGAEASGLDALLLQETASDGNNVGSGDRDLDKCNMIRDRKYKKTEHHI